MSLEAVEHVVHVAPAIDQVLQERAGADRDRLLIGVDETVAEQPPG